MHLRNTEKGHQPVGTAASVNDFRNNAGADGVAAFADCEAQSVFHRDGRDQLNAERYACPPRLHFQSVSINLRLIPH